MLTFMEINKANCFVMAVRRSRTSMMFNYVITSTRLESVTSGKHLGLYMCLSLDLYKRIQRISGNAFDMLGLITWVSRGAFSATTLKISYVTLVRPILDY